VQYLDEVIERVGIVSKSTNIKRPEVRLAEIEFHDGGRVLGTGIVYAIFLERVFEVATAIKLIDQPDELPYDSVG
jgi:hypothetical protein